jgi:hypothetical protein
MAHPFFEKPILNSPYDYPSQHWELDESGQPTQKMIEAWESLSSDTSRHLINRSLGESHSK